MLTLNPKTQGNDLRPPHCDQRVVHAPGECRVCDEYGWYLQQIREWWGMNFTTKEQDPTKMTCPAVQARPNLVDDDAVNWHGNVRQKAVCFHCQMLQSKHVDGTKCLFGSTDWRAETQEENEARRQAEFDDLIRRVVEKTTVDDSEG